MRAELPAAALSTESTRCNCGHFIARITGTDPGEWLESCKLDGEATDTPLVAPTSNRFLSNKGPGQQDVGSTAQDQTGARQVGLFSPPG